MAESARTVTYRFPAQNWTRATASSLQEYQDWVVATADLAGVGPNLVQNDGSIAASLPPVSVVYQTETMTPSAAIGTVPKAFSSSSTSSAPAHSTAAPAAVGAPSSLPFTGPQTSTGYYQSAIGVNFAEQVAHGGAYTWSQGVVPLDVKGWDHWIYPSTTSALDALNATEDSGTNLSVQSSDSTLTFLAGALIGAAGGAAVGAFQAAMQTRADRRRARTANAPAC